MAKNKTYNSKVIVAKNLSMVMGLRKEDSVTLEKPSGVSQKTIWNMSHADSDVGSPTVDKICKVAGALDMTPWLAFIPGLTEEIVKDNSLVKLVNMILEMPSDGREYLLSVAQREIQRPAPVGKEELVAALKEYNIYTPELADECHKAAIEAHNANELKDLGKWLDSYVKEMMQ